MANEKIKLTQDMIMAKNGATITYADAGGTMRRVKANLVEIVASLPTEAEAAPEQAATPPVQEAATPEEVPPASDTPPVETEASPEVPAPEKPKRSRKEKTMATAQTATKAKTKAPVKAKTPPARAKTPAKARTEASGIRTIGGKAVNLDGYEKTKAPGGGTSYHNGDPVAEKLAGKTLDEVYAVGAKTLKEDEKALRAKYKHLNPGMQRMAIGNRMRKVLIPKEAKN